MGYQAFRAEFAETTAMGVCLVRSKARAGRLRARLRGRRL
jgi:hypothetical protein